MKNLTNQLKNVEKRKKPKMLVVDDEPDNLDLLYRTFRRDFRVFKASSGLNALEVLAKEGEVAVIISDQRMPEMKGTEFLSKTVPDFPDTVRIILTGFTDVEDLVDAINSGQVYKYITKPWDPNELKAVVERATETYAVLKQRTQELNRAQAQTKILATIAQVAQVYDTPEACLEPIAQVFGEGFASDICILQLIENGQLGGSVGNYTNALGAKALDQDPLVAKAITSRQNQWWISSSSTQDSPEAEYYQGLGINNHSVIPIIFKEKLLGILSLQWQKAEQIKEDELRLINLSAQQVALALASVVCYQ